MSQESWESCSEWYNRLVGEKGHYFHEHVIFPKLLPLLALERPLAAIPPSLGAGPGQLNNLNRPLPGPSLSEEESPHFQGGVLQKTGPSSLLDLGCGQGVLSRALPPHVEYCGIDLSSSLIENAKKNSRSKKASFIVGDMTKPLPIDKKFTHAVFLLSLQNVEDQKKAIQNASSALLPSGILVIVLNHPCFRIPRQSAWGEDEGRKILYRRIDRYLSPMKIPINMHPGQKERRESLSFHYPLAAYSEFLFQSQLFIEELQEWISDKKSEGKKAKMEDRAREEIPLFLAIKCRKR